VTVHDIQTGTITRFIVDQWLAIDRGTFEDDITVAATREHEQLPSDYLLLAGGYRKLRDDHLWWSVFSRPLRSRYNRKQRMSVSFAFLYLSFMANAMYYASTPKQLTDDLFSFIFLPIDMMDVSAAIYF
jgi:hypothetical protein